MFNTVFHHLVFFLYVFLIPYCKTSCPLGTTKVKAELSILTLMLSLTLSNERGGGGGSALT